MPNTKIIFSAPKTHKNTKIIFKIFFQHKNPRHYSLFYHPEEDLIKIMPSICLQFEFRDAKINQKRREKR